MRIQSILRKKGSFVATIEPDTPIFEASRELARHRVGALVVSADGEHIDGLLSERDIACSLADHGERAFTMSARDLMTSDVTTCSSHATVDQLMAVMTERRVRHLPVVDEGRLCGIISIGDVVKHRLDELKQECETLHDYIELGR